MPTDAPQSVTGSYNPPVASPQAPVKQSPSASFLEAAKGNGNWINPAAVTKDMTGIGNRQEILERNERLAKARTLLSDIPRGPVLARADSEPALGMPNSRSSWPVQAVKDMFASIKRIGDHVYAPFTGQESPYDSMDEMIEDTTMLAGDFTGAGVASRIGKPAAANVLRTGIGGEPPKNMESVLSNRLNEINQKLEKHQGTYKERLALMDEKKDVQGNLMLVIKQRETGKPQLRGRKTMLNDEGIPKGDKVVSDKMYDRNLPLTRVQSEIKKIKEFARDTNLGQLTIDDISMHVYGSDEKWAKDRINAALKAADKEKARTLATPPTEMPPMSPLQPNIADNTTSIFARGANDNSLAALEDDIVGRPMNDAERQDWQRNILQEQLNRDPFQEKIDTYTQFKKEEMGKKNPDLVAIRYYDQRIKNAQKEKQDQILTNDRLQKDSGFDDEPAYGTPEFEAFAKPLVDNYLGVVYTPEELPLAVARFKKEGLTTEKLFDVVDILEVEGPKGLDKLITLLENNGISRTDKAMLRFARDLRKLDFSDYLDD